MAAERPRGWRRPLWWLYAHPDVLYGLTAICWPLAWILAFKQEPWPSAALAGVAVIAHRLYGVNMSTRFRLAVSVAARNAPRGDAGPPGGA